MDTKKPSWIALDTPTSSPACHYHYIQSFINNNGVQGIFAVIVEPLPPQQHSANYYSINQRSQQGAKLALKASQEAFSALREQQLNFDVSFLDLFMKYWKNNISLHFIENPLETTNSTSKEISKHQLSNQHHNALSNLSSLYDTSISILQITDADLAIYQIGYSQLVVLDSHHNIHLHGPSIGSLGSPPLLLAHPELKQTYPCHHIDITKGKLEMLILLSRGSTTSKKPQQIQDKAFHLSRLMDTQGVEYANEYLRNTLKKENCIVIKRNRRWYDGLSSALDRESSHLHQKIYSQDKHLQQLASKLNTLHAANQANNIKHNTSPLNTLQPNVKHKRSPLPLILSLFALSSSALIGYYLWQDQASNKENYQNNIVLLKQAQQQQATLSSHFKKLEQQYVLATEEIMRGRQLKVRIDNIETANKHKVAIDTIEKLPPKKASTVNSYPVNTTTSSKSPLLAVSFNTPHSNEVSEKGRQAKIKLEQIKRLTITQNIINDSITFAHYILQLKKKKSEISIMEELFRTTKNATYAKQKQLLEKRKEQLNKKMQILSQQYSTQLKRLCRYSSIYSPTIEKGASPLEKIALSHLKKQLQYCSPSKTLSATSIRKTLYNSYQRLDTRY